MTVNEIGTVDDIIQLANLAKALADIGMTKEETKVKEIIATTVENELAIPTYVEVEYVESTSEENHG